MNARGGGASARGGGMSACCEAARSRKAPTRMRRTRDVLAWLLPAALLALMPKCPACLAAYVMLWTGFGLSFSTATYLRWAMLALCFASLAFLIVRNLGRLRGALTHLQTRIER